jgi:ATP-binding cassette subfamily B protein
MQKINSKSVLKYFWFKVTKYPLLVIGALFAVPLTTFVNNFLPPMIAANILDKLSSGNFIKDDLSASFGWQIALYLFLLLFGIFTWRLVDFFVWPLERKVMKDIAEDVHSHLLILSANFHANSFSGSLVSQANKLIGAYIRIADTTVYGTLSMIWGVILTSVILATRAPLFVILFNITVVVFVGSAIVLSKKMRHTSALHAKSESKQTGALADSLTNVLAIKSFATKEFEKQRFSKFTKQTAKTHLTMTKQFMIQITSFSLFSRLLQFIALLTATVAIVYFDANIATVFLIFSYSSILADQLFNFTNSSLRNYNRSIGDASDMVKILQIKPKISDPDKPEKLKISRGGIRFEEIMFAYPDTPDDKLFNNLNLTIKPGEKLGLVGSSGGGKTTITKLLLRFLDIEKGKILIDGQSISEITQEDLRSSIAYVPQEPLLFHRTLKENISYGSHGASDKEITAIAKKANAHEFIKDLPDGYDTLVGERGVKLSGGQRQRIAIARAMIKNAPILVLDEATSALDSESESLIQDALWKLMEGRTAIVIAHRLSTVQKMDRIIVLENGSIVEQGSHRELIRKQGKYADLWNRQSGGFIDN